MNDIEKWMLRFKDGTPLENARAILNSLVHYRHGGRSWELEDRKTIVDALEAWSRIRNSEDMS